MGDWRLYRNIGLLSLPVGADYFLCFVNDFVNVLFAGKAGIATMGAIGVSNAVLNCTCFALIFGCLDAVSTHASQAFGAGDHPKTVVCFWRGLVFVGLNLLWFIPLLSFSENMFAYLANDHQVLTSMKAYIGVVKWGLPSLAIGDCIRRLTLARNFACTPFLLNLLAAVFHPLWCYFWTSYAARAQWENATPVALGLANVCTWSLSTGVGLLALLGRPDYFGLERRWFCPSWQIFEEMGAFIRTALGSYFYFAFECVYWEILVIVAARRGTTELAAQTAVSNLIVLLFSFQMGLSCGVSTLAGNAVGAREYFRVMPILRAGMITSFCMVLTWWILGILVRSSLPGTFGFEGEVADRASLLFFTSLFVQFVDGAQYVGAGVLRGLDDQTYLALLVSLVYYGVCAPVGTYLALEREWGLVGCYFMTFLGCIFLTGSFWRRARTIVKAAENPEPSVEMSVLLI